MFATTGPFGGKGSPASLYFASRDGSGEDLEAETISYRKPVISHAKAEHRNFLKGTPAALPTPSRGRRLQLPKAVRLVGTVFGALIAANLAQDNDPSTDCRKMRPNLTAPFLHGRLERSASRLTHSRRRRDSFCIRLA
jgi:hypothetical protein